METKKPKNTFNVKRNTIKSELLLRANPKRNNSFWDLVEVIDTHLNELRVNSTFKTILVVSIVNLIRYAELVAFQNGY